MTIKQLELLREMRSTLDNEFSFGTIGKKKFYTNKEASTLISINYINHFVIIDEGQCTVKQYNILTKIAGRKPKLKRELIGFSTAVEWIKLYSEKLAV